jgi:hypothetical protein
MGPDPYEVRAPRKVTLSQPLDISPPPSMEYGFSNQLLIKELHALGIAELDK